MVLKRGQEADHALRDGSRCHGEPVILRGGLLRSPVHTARNAVALPLRNEPRQDLAVNPVVRELARRHPARAAREPEDVCAVGRGWHVANARQLFINVKVSPQPFFAQ